MDTHRLNVWTHKKWTIQLTLEALASSLHSGLLWQQTEKFQQKFKSVTYEVVAMTTK